MDFGNQFAGMLKVFFKIGGLFLTLCLFAFLVSEIDNSKEHMSFHWDGKYYDRAAFMNCGTVLECELFKVEEEAAEEAYFDANNLSFYERNKSWTLELIILLGLPLVIRKMNKWAKELNKDMVN